MKASVVAIAIALAGCSTSGVRAGSESKDAWLTQKLDALVHVDLFDRPAVERELGVALQARPRPTIPSTVVYEGTGARLAPFSEVEYENRESRFAYLMLWLDDGDCHPSAEIEQKYDFSDSYFAEIDPDEAKRGVVVGSVFRVDGRKLRVGYRKTAAGDYCVKNVVVQATVRPT